MVKQDAFAGHSVKRRGPDSRITVVHSLAHVGGQAWRVAMGGHGIPALRIGEKHQDTQAVRLHAGTGSELWLTESRRIPA